jgi:hypothetical protein
MQSIRRSSATLIATLLAVLAGSTPAFARPAPLIENGPQGGTGSTGTGGAASSGGGFLDGWVQVGVAVLVAAAVLAVAISVVSRVRHHQPSHA